jgi:hypothetical protein
MPNGKGALECSYCLHWRGQVTSEYDYGPGICDYWSVDLPGTSGGRHRICGRFVPNLVYERDNRVFIERSGGTHESVKERMSWFGIELKTAMLYDFSYNYPPGLTELMPLTREESGKVDGE